MSQHFYSKTIGDIKYTVQLGWDKPLQQFYCVIESSQDEDDPFYSNLLEPNNPPLQHYVDLCSSIGIDLPSQMIEEVISDSKTNAVNRQVQW